MSKLIKANTLLYLIVAKHLCLKQNILILSTLFAHSVLKHNGYMWFRTIVWSKLYILDNLMNWCSICHLQSSVECAKIKGKKKKQPCRCYLEFFWMKTGHKKSIIRSLWNRQNVYLPVFIFGPLLREILSELLVSCTSCVLDTSKVSCLSGRQVFLTKQKKKYILI